MVGASHPAAVRTNRLAGSGGVRPVATLRGVRGLAAGLRGGAMGHPRCRCATRLSAIGGSGTGVGGMAGAATARPVFASASELGTWQVGGGMMPPHIFVGLKARAASVSLSCLPRHGQLASPAGRLPRSPWRAHVPRRARPALPNPTLALAALYHNPLGQPLLLPHGKLTLVPAYPSRASSMSVTSSLHNGPYQTLDRTRMGPRRNPPHTVVRPRPEGSKSVSISPSLRRKNSNPSPQRAKLTNQSQTSKISPHGPPTRHRRTR